jgi:hypothetical protein
MAAVIILAILVVGIVLVVMGVDRYRPRTTASPLTLPTHEVMVDPVTGMRQRVHVDPSTGERSYVDEPVPLPGTPMPPLARPGLLGTPPVQYPEGAGAPGGGYLVPPGGHPPAALPPGLPPGQG